MIETDFYSGSPSNLPPPDKQQEMDAANMASFGKYDYDPGVRAMTQQQMIYPGGYGFNNAMNPPISQPQQIIQPLQGVGTPYRYSPYGNIQPTYGMYNPYQQPIYPSYNMNPGAYMQQQAPAVIHIPGVGMNGEYLAPPNIQEQIDQMQLEYWTKVQEKDAKDSVDRRNSVYGYNSYGGYNYYGVSYYNPYQYNSINMDLAKQIDQIKQSAKEARISFDENLSRLSHNIIKDNYPDEVIKERYEGRTIEIQRNSVYDPYVLQEYARLDRLVPFDNSQFYRDQFAKASETFNKHIPKDSNMNETFSKMGLVAIDWELEEEQHRRRDLSTMYNSGDGGYKYFVRKKAEERYAMEHGLPIPNQNINGSQFNSDIMKQRALNSFPTLKDSVKLGADGTLNVTCNVGSHAGQTYSVNEHEAGYDEKRERFGRFMSSISGSIYKNYNGG
ncbi:MAG: hypothetical protein IKR19_07750 [Acholeplasmatales bacterium]|nr:hypothetical protein [Acholeplasmatales bacterium]